MSSHTKIWAHSYQLGILVFERTRTFPRHSRPVLGRRLEEACLDVTIELRHALMCSKNQMTKRLAHIDKVSDCIDELRIVLQFCKDTHILKAQPYKDMCDLIQSIGKQLGGLKKYESSNAPTLRPISELLNEFYDPQKDSVPQADIENRTGKTNS